MQLKRPIRSIHDFLLSTYFADGIRITIGVLLPPLLLSQFGLLQYGMGVALGAICVSITDMPGPILHRRNAMLITNGLIFMVALLTGVSNNSVLLVGLILALCSFVFSMFNIYGVRAASVGTAALLIMVLNVDNVRSGMEVLHYAFLLLYGGLWYTLLSYGVYRLRPFRLAQQTLSECISEVAIFLREKAKFYNEQVDINVTFSEILKLQIAVHEKQDATREILFKTREIVRDSTPEGRFLMILFVNTVDLFEQIMSTYYNYKRLHEQFDETGVLKDFEMAIKRISYALDDIAHALLSNSVPQLNKRLYIEIEKLHGKIQTLEQDLEKQEKYNQSGMLALKNIEINLKNILLRTETLVGFFNLRSKNDFKSDYVEVHKFIDKQRYEFSLFKENLTYKSALFRHALRVTVAMLLGYAIGQWMQLEYSYWILLSILVLSKPAFSLTKLRNFERVIGTLVGAGIGFAVLNYIKDENVLFGILLLCMIACYAFQRRNYVISVLFMTPYILIVFHFLDMGKSLDTLDIAVERVFDTLIGSGIALISSYILFPSWEYENLKDASLNILKANQQYFNQILKLYFEEDFDPTAYKLARKSVYISTANISSVFQRMFSEPKSKQILMQETHEFTTLNHLIFSYMSTLYLFHKEHGTFLKDRDLVKPIAMNSLALLNLAVKNIQEDNEDESQLRLLSLEKQEVIDADELLLQNQFIRIQSVAYDIYKLSYKLHFKAH